MNDLYVPAERTASIIEMSAGQARGAALHETPLYRTPMLGILAPTGSAIGWVASGPSSVEV